MANKRVDSLKAKQKKQKIIAAVLGVVFLGVLAFQGPRVWKQLHPPAAPATLSYNEKPQTTTTTGTPSLAAPTLGGSEAPSSTPSSGGSLASSSPPAVADGQLSSFSLFASKDPFAQQLSDHPPTSSSPSSGGTSGGSSGGSGGGGQSPSSGGSASAPRPGTAVISVNGTLYSVAVGNDFPAASSTDASVQSLFHLVSLTSHTAKISIVGGTYSSGAPAVTLQENKPVTLMNTADGTRYKLILKPAGTPVAAPATAAPTSTTSTTVTVPPPSTP
jgi:hypothetical protein